MVDARGGSRVIGERGASGAVSVTGERIVDGDAGCVEVSRAHGGAGQRQVCGGSVLTALGSLIVEEEEQFVLAMDDFGNPDRAADGESVLVKDFLVERAGVLDVVYRLLVVVLVILEPPSL